MRKTPIITGGVYGQKAVSISDLDEFLDWKIEQTGDATPQTLYAAVAWTFWAANQRAYNIAQVEYDLYPETVAEGDETEDNAAEFPFDLKPLQYAIELWLSLKGAAYIFREAKGNALADLRVLNANTIEVWKWDERGEPTIFRQRVGTEYKYYPAEQIIYFRTFNPRDDIKEGVSGGQVGKDPGALIYNANQWASAFFANGAIPAVILTTEGQINESEIERVRTTWQRFLGGVRRAWTTMVLRKGLKPEVIGQPVADLAMPELEKAKKEQILAAHGIPPGLAEAKTNRAERDALQYELFTQSLIPHTEINLRAAWQEQLFDDLGLRLVFHYDEIEVIQREEARKAEGLSWMVRDVLLPSYSANTISLTEYRTNVDVLFQSVELPGLIEGDSFVPEERTPPPMLQAQNDEDEEEEPQSANPKAALPWGRQMVCLVNLPDGETRRQGGAGPSTLTVQ